MGSWVGDEPRTLDGSTTGNCEFGLGEKELVCAGELLATSSVDNGRLWPEPNAKGVPGEKSGNGLWVPLRRLPGVELKTEYSSAKRGVVQPLDSSNRPELRFGVSNTGLGKMEEVGVCLGVGG